MLPAFMSLIVATSLAIGALLLGIVLVLRRLQQTKRAAAQLQREHQQCKSLMEQELAALRRTLEARLATSTLELEQAMRELDAFSYSVSHDLAAPARKIHGFAELLQDEASTLSDQGREWLNRIQHNSLELGDMIGALLRISRLGRAELNLRAVDLNVLVAEVVRDAGAGYPNTQVEIGPLPSIRCEQELMRQAFHNLVANAFKFSGKRAAPRIEIGTLHDAEESRFFVRDNGDGFNMRSAGKLFGVFQRLHRESEFPGIGAGLAIAKSIIQRHDGRIWAESEPGEGACFLFTIGCGRQRT